MRAAKVYDDAGREIPGGAKGYRYFGRARELPGVKELFEGAGRDRREVEEGSRGETRAELRRKVDAAYYGYGLDEEDGKLLEYERAKEKEAWENLMKSAEGQKTPADWEPLPGDTGDGQGWRVPTREEVQEELVERRKRRLLDALG